MYVYEKCTFYCIIMYIVLYSNEHICYNVGYMFYVHCIIASYKYMKKEHFIVF